MVSFETSDLRKIGQGLITFGVIFTLIGVVLYFDKGFLAIGNILIGSGLLLTTGLNFVHFFLKTKYYKGSLPLAVGFVFVIMGCPITGLFLETCGFIFLFRELCPIIASFLWKFPILGPLLSQLCASPYFTRSRPRRCPV